MTAPEEFEHQVYGIFSTHSKRILGLLKESTIMQWSHLDKVTFAKC